MHLNVLPNGLADVWVFIPKLEDVGALKPKPVILKLGGYWISVSTQSNWELIAFEC